MPFNVSGVFSRLYSWISDRDSGIKINAPRMDQEFDGIVAGINAVVDGTQPFIGNVTAPRFIGPLEVTSGSAAAPSITRTGDTNTGVFFPVDDQVAVTAGGLKIGTFSASGLSLLGDYSGGGSVYRDIIAGGYGGEGAKKLQNVADANLSGSTLTLTIPNLGSTSYGWYGATISFRLGGGPNTGGVSVVIASPGASSSSPETARTTTGATLPDGYLQHGALYEAVFSLLPTGWVIRRLPEYGSNGNGQYWRYEDGLQICTHEFSASAAINVGHLGGFRSNEQSWTFPAAFVAEPAFDATAADLTAFGCVETGNTSATLGRFVWTAVTSQTAAARAAKLVAIGRWY